MEYEKEIERLENIIKENLEITSEAENSNFLNFANIPYFNQNTMENYDIISMISQLETPTYAVKINEKFDFRNPNIKNNNYRNLNTFNSLNNCSRKNTNSFLVDYDNNTINENNLQETKIIDYSKPLKNSVFDYNQMLDNSFLNNLKTPKKNEVVKYSTIQQKKKKVEKLNNLSADDEINDEYVI